MPKRESVRWDRLSPVFASAFNGSVSVEGSRNGPDVRSVREGEDRCAVDVRFTGIFGKNEKNRISKLHCFEVLFFSAEFALLLFAPVCSRAMTIAFGLSAVYPVAGKDALRVVMFDFPHFGH